MPSAASRSTVDSRLEKMEAAIEEAVRLLRNYGADIQLIKRDLANVSPDAGGMEAGTRQLEKRMDEGFSRVMAKLELPW